jgi:hypothetical protein
MNPLCPECGCESYLAFDDFAETIKDDKGVRILCEKCSAARTSESTILDVEVTKFKQTGESAILAEVYFNGDEFEVNADALLSERDIKKAKQICDILNSQK